MCFSVIAGKKATLTGSVILGANDDWPGCPGQVHHVPAGDWSDGDFYVSVKGTKIPQPKKTFAYTFTAAAYETGTFPVSWADGMNENQVAVSMQGVYAFENFQKSGDVLEADDLSILVLQRGKTARQSIAMLGLLIEQYGFSVSSIDGAQGTACLAIADPNEGFFFEIIPGGYWAAKRVEDDCFECRPNCFGIHQLNLEDEKNYMYSANLKAYLKENGYLKEGELIDFASIFGQNNPINKEYGGAQNPINQMRRMRAIELICGAKHKLEDQIYFGKVSKKISAFDVMDCLRDSLEGTKYDLSLAKEAGTGKNPFWMEVSTSIGQSGTVISMVAEMRNHLPKEIAGRLWIGLSNIHLSTFIPSYLSAEGFPKAYTIGTLGEFDLSSAWWAFEELGELCYRNYKEIAKKLVIPICRQLEKKFIVLCDSLEKDFEQLPEDQKKSKICDVTTLCANQAYSAAIELGKKIKGKYLCNTILDWL